MTLTARALCYLCLPAVMFTASLSLAHASTCRDVSDEVVKTATSELLQDVAKNDPQLAELDEKTLVLEGGKKLLEAPQPDFKARGWMMLLWYGGKTGQEIVAKSAEGLTDRGRPRASVFRHGPVSTGIA